MMTIRRLCIAIAAIVTSSAILRKLGERARVKATLARDSLPPERRLSLHDVREGD